MAYICLACVLAALSIKSVFGHGAQLPKIDKRLGYSVQWHRAGSKLNLECEANYPIRWQYPDNSIYEGFVAGRMSTSNKIVDSTYKSQLQIDYLVHADTAKYTCHKKSEHAVQSNVYIFSNGDRENKLFLHFKAKYKRPVYLYLEEASVVPCLTTYEPKTSGCVNCDADVSLWMNGTEFTQDESVQYNYEKGFEISPTVITENFQDGKTLTVECKVYVEYMHDTISFQANVIKNSKTTLKSKSSNWLQTSNAKVIGVGIGLCLLLLILVLITFFVLKNRHRRLLKRVQRHRDPEQLSALHRLFPVRRSTSSCYAAESAPSTRGYTPVVDPNSLRYDRRYELSKDWLWYDPQLAPLGKGRFGKVVCGTLHLPLADAEKYPALAQPRKVAIKLPNDGRDPAQQKALLDELKIMGNLGHHPNVLGLIGAVTEHMVDGILFMVMELCESGSLLFYLRKYRTKFIDQTKYLETQSDEEDGYLAPRGKAAARVSFQEFSEDPLCGSTYMANPESLSTSDLVAFSYQAANGMAYLSHRINRDWIAVIFFRPITLKPGEMEIRPNPAAPDDVKLIHRDLAARNLLLTDRRILKIADFGLAKPDYTYHRSISSDTPLPVKWLAIGIINKIT